MSTYVERYICKDFVSIHVHTGGMTLTKSMILAARRAEYDYYQRGRMLGPDRFIPTSDTVIKVMLEAALKLVEVAPAPITSRRKMAAQAPDPKPVAPPTPLAPDPPKPVQTPKTLRRILRARKPRPQR